MPNFPISCVKCIAFLKFLAYDNMDNNTTVQLYDFNTQQLLFKNMGENINTFNISSIYITYLASLKISLLSSRKDHNLYLPPQTTTPAPPAYK